MTAADVDRSQWEDITPDDRKIPWKRITAPEARSGPVSTHPVLADRGFVHTAPWWVDGTLYTDNVRWFGHVREQAQQSGQHLAVEEAPDGPPVEHRAQVDAMRRYAELHTLRPARPLPCDEQGQPLLVRFY
ncbi:MULTISPECIES: hypothetical protein [unclassified Streptomyces]|uniref:hypothetical protein n=1 Tax=unclassified Streptomyces TaxID=2593676 RepID=UPI000DC799A1|nr:MULTISPECIES: hypothetical protein [unclassified Streptomyces]AWZ03328.1 hypothetical protein DRB89_00260 [Streptomyces sp. ICC4]AWZ11132.1 hypothetical protein DRB96_00910 [Streptomyces sp. ICC1]